MTIDLNKAGELVIATAQEAGSYIRKEQKSFSAKQINVKGLHDFVTHVDKASEEFIYSKLKDLIPDAGFLGEEQTSEITGKDYKWIVDPLDGTTNFIHGLHPYSVSIGLMKENDLVLGVVYEVGADETFYAWGSSPAYCNGKQIRVSRTSTVKDSLIATGFPYNNFSRLDAFNKSMEYFMRNSHGVRRLGSAATDLVYVARGNFEAFYEYDLSPWDVAGAAFILQQAGGKICDFSGGNDYIFGKEIIAANEIIMEEFYGIVHRIMTA
jgi:myo-inositol-1(or 4)-monophosphatase